MVTGLSAPSGVKMEFTPVCCSKNRSVYKSCWRRVAFATTLKSARGVLLLPHSKFLSMHAPAATSHRIPQQSKLPRMTVGGSIRHQDITSRGQRSASHHKRPIRAG
ncbi:unnamed protein product [Lasius platythorax]|uniref:Uncharacterized protein n=1 Tax=Lasius platythorax TaxID=488582 RepID=A0AAV2MZ78_9HYME